MAVAKQDRNASRFFGSGSRDIVMVATISVLVLISTYCTLPPFLERRQKTLAQVGNMIITNAETSAQKNLPELRDAWPTRPSQPTGAPFKSLTQEEASNQAGFQVLIPQPPDETWNKEFIIFSKGKVVVAGHYKGLPISISQWKSTDETFEFAVNDANLERIQIRNRKGYWLEAVPTGLVGGGGSAFALSQDDIEWQVENEDIITWEENGIVFLFSGDDELHLEQLLTIANYLRP